MNILFIIKVKSLMLVQWSYRSPQQMVTIELRMVIIFSTCSLFHLNTFFFYPFLEPHLSTYHSVVLLYIYRKYRIILIRVWLFCNSSVVHVEMCHRIIHTTESNESEGMMKYCFLEVKGTGHWCARSFLTIYWKLEFHLRYV